MPSSWRGKVWAQPSSYGQIPRTSSDLQKDCQWFHLSNDEARLTINLKLRLWCLQQPIYPYALKGPARLSVCRTAQLYSKFIHHTSNFSTCMPAIHCRKPPGMTQVTKTISTRGGSHVVISGNIKPSLYGTLDRQYTRPLFPQIQPLETEIAKNKPEIFNAYWLFTTKSVESIHHLLNHQSPARPDSTTFLRK